MSCPSIPNIAYEDFRKRLRGTEAGSKRFPWVGSLELNYRCNLRCQHCYLAHGHTGIPGKEELSLAEIQCILDEVVDEGTLWFLLTGGEPLLRRDFLDIYAYAKRKGLLVTLFTNATMITPRIADYLGEYRPFQIEISVYGYSQETYEAVTGIPGSHRQFRRGVELLLERGIKFDLKTILMTINQHELQEMKAMAQAYQAKFRYDPMINARIDGDSSPLNLRISPDQILEIEVNDPGRMESWQDFTDQFSDFHADLDYLYACGAGYNMYHIDPYGELSVCLIARQQRYDLRNGTFAEGWHNFLKEVRYQPPKGANPCASCALHVMCGQCPGWSYLEQGDQEQPVPFQCELAHLRAEQLGIIQRS